MAHAPDVIVHRGCNARPRGGQSLVSVHVTVQQGRGIRLLVLGSPGFFAGWSGWVVNRHAHWLAWHGVWVGVQCICCAHKSMPCIMLDSCCACRVFPQDDSLISGVCKQAFSALLSYSSCHTSACLMLLYGAQALPCWRNLLRFRRT